MIHMLTRQHLHRYRDARARAYVCVRAAYWKFVETMETKNTLHRALQRVILMPSNDAGCLACFSLLEFEPCKPNTVARRVFLSVGET